MPLALCSQFPPHLGLASSVLFCEFSVPTASQLIGRAPLLKCTSTTVLVLPLGGSCLCAFRASTRSSCRTTSFMLIKRVSASRYKVRLISSTIRLYQTGLVCLGLVYLATSDLRKWKRTMWSQIRGKLMGVIAHFLSLQSSQACVSSFHTLLGGMSVHTSCRAGACEINS